jgi:hypothetical protein
VGRAGSFPGFRIEKTCVLPFSWKILDGEDSIEERDEEGDRPQWKML